MSSGCSITDAGVKALAKPLAKLKNVQMLDLSGKLSVQQLYFIDNVIIRTKGTFLKPRLWC